MNKLPVLLLWGAGIAAFCGHAATAADTFDYSIKLKASALGEGARDLGTGTAEETTEGMLEIWPEARWQPTQDFAAYVRLQGFLASDQVVLQDNNDRPQRTDGFVGLRELWFEYGGLTSYPGEVLRIGRQRVRHEDALWFDRDIEAVRWIFDTTLVQADIGVAQAFDTYRSDDIELPTELQDRFNAFASVSSEWAPTHRIGLRAAYADDSGETAQPGEAIDPTGKPVSGQLAWIGARLENGFYDARRSPKLAYWAETTLLTGTEETPVLDPLTQLVTATPERDVNAWGGDVGLRLKLSERVPVQVGVAYAYGEGGGDAEAEESKNFRQTGLQSNRSRFTGTRTLVHRFNDALRAELSNLSVATAFASVQFERGDASVVYSQFRRDQDSAPIITDGVDVQPLPGNKDIGDGVDVVLTRYFGELKDPTDPEGDLQTSLRLRASWFGPGEAYGPTATDDAYRVMLEGTLQF